ncbi:MAG: FAD-dependent oxidoreductase [Myxococcota bacterium]
MMPTRSHQRRAVGLRTVLAALALALALASGACAGGSANGPARPQDLRIAVIGAGASGLTAAYTLKKLGYDNVTVYEALPQVGGKVSSYAHDKHVFELGAVMAMADYTTVLGLAHELGIRLQDFQQEWTIHGRDGQHHDVKSYLSAKHGLRHSLEALHRMEHLALKYPHLHHANLGADPDLYLPFAAYARKHGLEALTDGFKPFIVGCGYGYYEEVPALYVIKLARMMENTAVRSALAGISPGAAPFTRVFPEGFQKLWEAVAARLHVRLNHRVTRIVRKPLGPDQWNIFITAAGSTAAYDAVVISSPLDKALQFLDASPEERDLFSRIQTYQYFVTVFEGDGLPTKEAVVYETATAPESIGHVIVLHHKYEDARIWTAYQLARKAQGPEEVTRILRDDVMSLGGRVDTVIRQQAWSYFPHVKTEDLQAGFYERMEALQGSQGTYYVGAIMNFETVEHTAAYAQRLMLKHFQARAPAAGRAPPDVPGNAVSARR